MSFFAYRKTQEIYPARKAFSWLRATLDWLECVRDETPQVAESRRILAGGITEMDRKTT
jgi:hypothetical protein